MNELTPRPEKHNPFARLARAMSSHRLDGKKFGFNKGAYCVGETRILENGTELAVILSELRIGWKRFFNGSVSDFVIGLVAADFIPPKRADLGDIDQSLWETESNGSRKDPWVLGYEVPMVALADDELFTFVTSSRGGYAAIGDLCAEYMLETNMYPAISLSSESYMHKIKSYGRIFVPRFPVVKYVDAEKYDRLLADSRAGTTSAPSIAEAPKPIAGGEASALAAFAKPKLVDDLPPRRDDGDPGPYYGGDYGGHGPIDDDIPFMCEWR